MLFLANIRRAYKFATYRPTKAISFAIDYLHHRPYGSKSTSNSKFCRSKKSGKNGKRSSDRWKRGSGSKKKLNKKPSTISPVALIADKNGGPKVALIPINLFEEGQREQDAFRDALSILALLRKNSHDVELFMESSSDLRRTFESDDPPPIEMTEEDIKQLDKEILRKNSAKQPMIESKYFTDGKRRSLDKERVERHVLPGSLLKEFNNVSIAGMHLNFEMNMTNLRDAILNPGNMNEIKNEAIADAGDSTMALSTNIQVHPEKGKTVPLHLNALIHGTVSIDPTKFSKENLNRLQVSQFNEYVTAVAANLCSKALQKGFPMSVSRTVYTSGALNDSEKSEGSSQTFKELEALNENNELSRTLKGENFRSTAGQATEKTIEAKSEGQESLGDEELNVLLSRNAPFGQAVTKNPQADEANRNVKETSADFENDLRSAEVEANEGNTRSAEKRVERAELAEAQSDTRTTENEDVEDAVLRKGTLLTETGQNTEANEKEVGILEAGAEATTARAMANGLDTAIGKTETAERFTEETDDVTMETIKWRTEVGDLQEEQIQEERREGFENNIESEPKYVEVTEEDIELTERDARKDVEDWNNHSESILEGRRTEPIVSSLEAQAEGNNIEDNEHRFQTNDHSSERTLDDLDRRVRRFLRNREALANKPKPFQDTEGTFEQNEVANAMDAVERNAHALEKNVDVLEKLVDALEQPKRRLRSSSTDQAVPSFVQSEMDKSEIARQIEMSKGLDEDLGLSKYRNEDIELSKMNDEFEAFKYQRDDDELATTFYGKIGIEDRTSEQIPKEIEDQIKDLHTQFKGKMDTFKGLPSSYAIGLNTATAIPGKVGKGDKENPHIVCVRKGAKGCKSPGLADNAPYVAKKTSARDTGSTRSGVSLQLLECGLYQKALNEAASKRRTNKSARRSSSSNSKGSGCGLTPPCQNKDKKHKLPEGTKKPSKRDSSHDPCKRSTSKSSKRSSSSGRKKGSSCGSKPSCQSRSAERKLPPVSPGSKKSRCEGTLRSNDGCKGMSSTKRSSNSPEEGPPCKRSTCSSKKKRSSSSSSKKSDACERSSSKSKDPCRRSPSSSSKKSDFCKRSSSKSKDRCKRSSSKSKDPCKRSSSKSKDPCKRSSSKSKDPCKRSSSKSKDPCKRSSSKSKDPCKRSSSKSKDPCKRSSSKSKDPCKRSSSKSKDPCKRSSSKSKDPCKRSSSKSSKSKNPCKRSSSSSSKKSSTSCSSNKCPVCNPKRKCHSLVNISTPLYKPHGRQILETMRCYSDTCPPKNGKTNYLPRNPHTNEIRKATCQKFSWRDDRKRRKITKKKKNCYPDETLGMCPDTDCYRIFLTYEGNKRDQRKKRCARRKDSDRRKKGTKENKMGIKRKAFLLPVKCEIQQTSFYSSESVQNEKAVILSPHKVCKRKASLRPVKDNDVRVCIDCVALSDSDIHMFETGAKKYPQITLGNEASGVVQKVGRKVTNVKPGDHVALECGVPCGTCELCRSGRYNLCQQLTFKGCLKKYCTHPASFCHKIIKRVPLSYASMVYQLSLGCNACRHAGIKPNSNVAIIGSCAMTLCTAMCARAMGCSNICVICSTENTLDIVTENITDKVECIDSQTTVNGIHRMICDSLCTNPDTVINCLCSTKTMNASIMALKPAGICVVSGFLSECVAYNVMDALMKEIRIVPSFRSKNMFPLAIHLLERKQIPIDCLIADCLEWKDLEAGFERALSESNCGPRKVVVQCRQDDETGDGDVGVRKSKLLMF